MPEVLGTIRVPTWRLTCSQKHSLKIYHHHPYHFHCFFASLALRHWLTDLLMDSQNTLSVLSLWPDSTYNLTSNLTISQSLTIIQAFPCATMSWFSGLLVCSRSFHHQLPKHHHPHWQIAPDRWTWALIQNDKGKHWEATNYNCLLWQPQILLWGVNA